MYVVDAAAQLAVTTITLSFTWPAKDGKLGVMRAVVEERCPYALSLAGTVLRMAAVTGDGGPPVLSGPDLLDHEAVLPREELVSAVNRQLARSRHVAPTEVVGREPRLLPDAHPPLNVVSH